MDFVSESQKAATQMPAGQRVHSEAHLGKGPLPGWCSSWQNLDLSDRNIQGPSFLLDVSWRLSSVPRSCPQFLATGVSSKPAREKVYWQDGGCNHT